jgi:UDP-glucose 4-epimerase
MPSQKIGSKSFDGVRLYLQKVFMKYLVTGATGFVGSWLVRRLVADGHSVAVVTRRASDLWRIRPWLSLLTQIDGDLCRISESSPAILSFAPETVLHLAWTGGNSSKFLNDAAQVYANIPGSMELMRIAAQAGARTFINFGSCVEYGQYSIPVRESDPVLPMNLYGRAKYTVEELGMALAPVLDFRFASMRLFWAYGPADDEARLMPSLIRKMLSGQRHPMTAGEQLWDYIYIEDVIEAVVRVANTPSATGIFNLGSGKPEKLGVVAGQIAALVGEQSLLGLGDIPYGVHQVMHLEADVTKLRTLTGWEPRVDLPSGLLRTVEWYKKGSRELPPL